MEPWGDHPVFGLSRVTVSVRRTTQIGRYLGGADDTDTAGGGGAGERGTAQAGRSNSLGHFVVEACLNQEEDRWKEVMT